MTKRLYAACAIGALAATTHAGVAASDSTGNDTHADADEIVFDLSEDVVADAFLFSLDNNEGSGDVDFFKFTLPKDVLLVVTTATDFGPLFPGPDTTLALFAFVDEQLVELASDEDSGNNGSTISSFVQYQIAEAGEYYLGVSGKGDNNFDGFLDVAPDGGDDEPVAHGQQGFYLLTVTAAIPTPGSMALCAGAIGLLGLRSRSRR